MRTLSQTIKDVLAMDYAETKDVVIITIPPQFGAVNYPETTLYLANGEGVFLDGIQYENKLRGISAIKFTLGKAPDNAEIVLENVSRTLGFTLTDFQRMLDGSKVVIKRAFKTAPTTWETDTMFTGYIRDVKVSQDRIEVSVTSDMSRRGTSVAGTTLTQRCILKFNVNGSGVGTKCGWGTNQPGNPLSCDKGLDSPNGCRAHGNEHRFGGVPAFTTLDVPNGYDVGVGGGWGEGSGGGWCISLNSKVLLSRDDGFNVWIDAGDLIVGDYLTSIDHEGNFVRAKILGVEQGITDKLYTLLTSKGYQLSCTGGHGIMEQYNKGNAVEAHTLSYGSDVLVYDYETNTHSTDRIKSFKAVPQLENSKILRISLEHPYHMFMAADNELGAIVSHNIKPVYSPDNFLYAVAYNQHMRYEQPSIA